MTRLPLLLALLLVAAPATALVGPPVSGQDPLNAFHVYMATTGQFCSSADPQLGTVSAPLLSSLASAPSGSTRRWQLHIQAMPTDATPCPPIDLAFLSAITPWPATRTTKAVSAACGVSGNFEVGPSAGGYYAWFVGSVAAACNAGVSGSVYIFLGIARLQPSEYMLCAPVAASVPCAGAYEETGTYAGGCAAGHRNGDQTYVTPYVGAYRWCTEGDTVYLSDPAGIVTLESRQGSCRVRVPADVDTTGACPAALGAFIWSQRWGQMLP